MGLLWSEPVIGGGCSLLRCPPGPAEEIVTACQLMAYHALKSFQPLFSCILLVAVLGLFLQAGDPCWCWWLPTLACLSVLFLFTSYVQLIVTMGPSPYYPRGVNSYLTALGLLGYPSVFERKSPWPWRMVFVTCSWIFLSEYFYIYVYQRDWNIIFWSFVLFICCWYQSNSISFLKLRSV